ncbi:hypothetical protein BC941DRAFT_434655 [Chlamydoabsidia padenii]|nr:hypothetical protein BC941DRAFT_434655 [Chlamydoabsidia padenii]
MSLMHFIRQAKNKPEIFPIVGILGCALGGAVFISIHQARAPDVVWDHKDNKFPWQDIQGNEQVKLTTVNQKYDNRWHRTHW